MFSKLVNNQKRIIVAARKNGFEVNDALNAGTNNFTYLVRSTDAGFSVVAVSYRKHSPMVKIRHKYADGSVRKFEKVLVDKRVWQEIHDCLSATPQNRR